MKKMKRKWYETKLSANHFCLLVGLLWLITHITPIQNEKENNKGRLTLLQPEEWSKDISTGNCFILLGDTIHTASREMKRNMEIIAHELPDAGHFYYMDLSTYSSFTSSAHLSGVPMLIALKDGLEISRAAGIIPLTNLRRICNQPNKN